MEKKSSVNDRERESEKSRVEEWITRGRECEMEKALCALVKALPCCGEAG
jgi:hypothetical protein